MVRLRNQINCIIGYSLGSNCDPSRNGEWKLQEKLGPEVRFFCDAGANRGEWTEKMLKESPVSTGILYEPEKNAYQGLQKLFQNNERIKVIEKALSNRCRSERFYVHDLQMNSSLNTKEESDTSYLVTVSTLDAEFENFEGVIDFLKIDVEGEDAKVIEGAMALMKIKKIRFLQFEYGPYWIQGSSFLADAIKNLSNHGYEVFLIRENGLSPFPYNIYGEYWKYSNFFAILSEEIGLVRDLIRDDL